MNVEADTKVEVIRQLMGAAHVFSSAVDELLERTLAEASGATLAMSQVKLLLLIARPGQRYKVTDIAFHRSAGTAGAGGPYGFPGRPQSGGPGADGGKSVAAGAV
jgi:hypothetical protein